MNSVYHNPAQLRIHNKNVNNNNSKELSFKARIELGNNISNLLQNKKFNNFKEGLEQFKDYLREDCYELPVLNIELLNYEEKRLTVRQGRFFDFIIQGINSVGEVIRVGWHANEKRSSQSIYKDLRNVLIDSFNDHIKIWK